MPNLLQKSSLLSRTLAVSALGCMAATGSTLGFGAEKYPAMEGAEAKARPVYRADQFGDLSNQVDSPARRTKSVDLAVQAPSAQAAPAPTAPAPEPNRAPAPMTEKAQKISESAIQLRMQKREPVKHAHRAAPTARVAKMKIKPAAQVAAKVAAAAPDRFDSVPADQRGLIARRMEIAEKLIREYGRAYDYRVVTLAELEKIQSELEAEKGLQKSVQKAMQSPMGPEDALNMTAPISQPASEIAKPEPKLAEKNQERLLDPRELARLKYRTEIKNEPRSNAAVGASDDLDLIAPIPPPAQAEAAQVQQNDPTESTDPWKGLEE